jgi:hypothetical protein
MASKARAKKLEAALEVSTVGPTPIATPPKALVFISHDTRDASRGRLRMRRQAYNALDPRLCYSAAMKVEDIEEAILKLAPEGSGQISPLVCGIRIRHGAAKNCGSGGDQARPHRWANARRVAQALARAVTHNAANVARMSQRARPEVAGPMTGSAISGTNPEANPACRFAHAGYIWDHALYNVVVRAKRSCEVERYG